mmetsp:Transcript_387/g.564  ORF Transcript_387/g.564 Transcript_387/m.564 type:complete len:126 (-) Transcript_387:884-1261(-)
MKLTLIILLLTGVSTLALNLRSDLEMMMLKGSDGRDLAVRQLKKSEKSEKEERESTGKGSDDNPCKPNPCDKGEICKRDGSGYTCVTKSKCHQERTASFHFYHTSHSYLHIRFQIKRHRNSQVQV